MTFQGRGPWWVSTAVHLVLGVGAWVLLVQEPRPSPPAVSMRLVAAPGAPSAEPARATWVPPTSRAAAPVAEPKLPGWREDSPSLVAPPTTVPVSLDDLLGPASEAPVPESPLPASLEAGWTGPGGLGYSPPPLPPPGLAPPQGARWALKLSIPGGGGFARSFEGLDSGHPDLDRWLEEYLRTVSFPSSPDGQDYVVRWTLRLETGRPQ